MREQRIDAFLAPPLATPAFPHGGSKDLQLASTYTFVWNAVHFPSGVVPITRVRGDETRGRRGDDRFDRLAKRVDDASAGLPVGALLAVRPWQDGVLLGLMRALDRAARTGDEFPRTPVVP
jgi:fatty acid amide hydrolase